MRNKNTFLCTKNKDNFEKLLSFGKDMLSILEKISIIPVTYGSLAYAAYIQDNEIFINDIDFLIPESKFQEVIKEIKKDKNLKVELTPHHTIKVYKGEFLIELDSIEYYLENLSSNFEEFIINNSKFNVLNIYSLIERYKIAYNLSVAYKKKEYLKKLDNLYKYISE